MLRMSEHVDSIGLEHVAELASPFADLTNGSSLQKPLSKSFKSAFLPEQNAVGECHKACRDSSRHDGLIVAPHVNIP